MSKQSQGETPTASPASRERRARGSDPAPASRRRSARSRLAWLLLGLVLLAVLAVGLLATLRSRQPMASKPAPTHEPVFSGMSDTERTLRTALASAPQDPDAHRALGRYLLAQQRPFEALWHFRQVVDLDTTDRDASLDVARSLIRTGLAARTARMIQTSLAQTPRNVEARRVLAEAMLALARPEPALTALQDAGSGLGTSAAAQLLLGDARFALGDWTRARAAYQRATELEPEGAAGYARLGRLALATRQWEEAAAAFEAAREREPGEAGHNCRLGVALWGAGRQTEAEQLWRQIAAGASGYAPVRLALGNAHRGRKEWDAAATHLSAALSADPSLQAAHTALAEVMTAMGDRASAFYQRGFYFLQTDRPHRAVEEFRRMMALAPERISGPLMMSLALVQMKRIDLAAVEIERGLARHPGDTRLLARLSALHVLGRNDGKAKQLCEEWLKQEPNAAEPYRVLGRIERENGRLSEALQFYEQGLARDAGNAELCFEAAKTLAAIRGPENARRALELAQRATELGPRTAEHWHLLGVTLRGAGRQAEAASAFLRALDLDRSLVASCNALVEIAGREGRRETSRFYAGLVTELQNRSRTSDGLWRAVFQRPRDAVARERLARFLLGAGDLRRASYQLEELKALRPGDPAVRRELEVVERLLDLQAA